MDAAAYVNEADIALACGRKLGAAPDRACFDRFAHHETLKITSKLSKIFGAGLGRIALQGSVNNGLRQARIEVAACALHDKDSSVAFVAEVVAVSLVDLATFRIWRANHNQRAACGRQRWPNRVKNFGVSIYAVIIGGPKTGFIAD